MPDPGAKPDMGWHWRHQAWVNLLVGAVVAAAAINIYVRNSDSDGVVGDPSSRSLLGLIALVGLALPTLTRRWSIWFPVCVLSVAGWIPFLGPMGEMSCVDCGFALLIPLGTSAVQLLLVGLAMVLPSMRHTPHR